MNELFAQIGSGMVSGAIAALIAAITFTTRFSERMGALEARATEQEKRLDRLEKQIFEALYRIEQKIDHKQDRS
jgi:hypothetical protein